MLDFNLNKNCYGCTACTSICPKNAIQMEENSEGFLIPHIDEDKCIKCMLCDKSCSYLNSNDNELSSPKQIFSLYRKNPTNNISTSSGIFYDLATSIITSGGYVCGCIWNDSMEAVHIITDNIKMLEPHFKAVVETIEKIRKENKGDNDKIKSELKELGEQEIEVSEYTKVNISAFDSCEAIEPAKIIALSFMIND